jgi:hypothetical protein
MTLKWKREEDIAAAAAKGMHDRLRPMMEKKDAEIARLKGRLTEIAAIAHHGGLLNLTEGEAMTGVRKLTLDHWDKFECERLQLKQCKA